MRLYELIVENTANQTALDSITAPFRQQGAKISVYEQGTIIHLDTNRVPKDLQQQGIGSKFMQALCDYADQSRKTIFLSPSKDFGASSVGRLQRFYSRFGFRLNRGRKRDFRSQDSMVRDPKPSSLKA